jgi:hypothetical protein
MRAEHVMPPLSLRLRRMAALAAVALFASLALTLSSGAGRAQAATGCSGAGPTAGPDPAGWDYSTRYCYAYSAGYMKDGGPFWWMDPSVNSGYLRVGTSWFVCQAQFSVDNPKVGTAQNNWWLYTEGDVAYSNHGWGWFPATRVSGGANWQPVPGLTHCAAAVVL